MRDAIKKAETLSCRIKDIRDELNILRSVAGYQKTIQETLAGSNVPKSLLTSNYVVSDIKEMDIVVNRIQSAASQHTLLSGLDINRNRSTQLSHYNRVRLRIVRREKL